MYVCLHVIEIGSKVYLLLWHVIEIVGERWCIVDPVASNTMRISGLKRREQPEKVTISTQTCHSYVYRVCLSNAGLTSDHRRSHAERPLANYDMYEALTTKVCVF